MQFKKKQPKRLSIDITPLIDVIFLLLIFFMVSTTFITAPGIHVNLPTVSTKPKPTKQKSLEVSITSKNQIFLNGKSIKKHRLQKALARSKKETGRSTLIIRADGKVQHQLVVFVMDAAKQTGIGKLSIATKQKRLK
ncbi:MAG: biopolymer transporter ExbD [Proteobacteria bacterium]|nr:biopolymer transporter ExbD [Pseudomonadota bacterium]